MGGAIGRKIVRRRPRRARASNNPVWTPKQRAWIRQAERIGEMLAKLRMGNPLHGEKWRKGMQVYYSRCLADLFEKVPPGLEDYLLEMAQRLGIKVA